MDDTCNHLTADKCNANPNCEWYSKGFNPWYFGESRGYDSFTTDVCVNKEKYAKSQESAQTN
jgi:hypothetical protein